MYRNTKTETMILGNPSSRKSNRHGEIGVFVPILVMTHAKLLANDVANGAAEMKRPVLKASSSRLKKKDIKNGTPTNAASPMPRAARRASKEENENATDWSEAIRPHDATQMDTMWSLA